MKSKYSSFKPINQIEMKEDELKDLFQLIDYERRGFILTEDLIQILETLHQEAKSTALYQILTYMKGNGKDKVFFEEFQDILTKKLTNLNDEEDLEKLFGVYRQSNKNVQFDSLKKIAQNLGERIDDDDLKCMIWIADVEHGKEVDFDNFYEIMSTKYDQKYIDILQGKEIKQTTKHPVQKQQSIKQGQNTQVHTKSIFSEQKKGFSKVKNK